MGRARTAAALALAGAALGLPASAQATHDVTITQGPPNATNSPSATFHFSATHTPAGPFECKLETAADYSACTSPKTYSALGEGQHTFSVRGTSGPGPADTDTWTVDFTPPDTMLTASPPALTNSSTATFEFNSPDVTATFECSLNGSAFSACTSPHVYSGLSDATRNFKVRAIDAATNTDVSSPAVDWTVDTTPPDTTITAGPGPKSNLKQPTLEFSASEPGGTFACAVNGGAFVTCTSPHVTAALADGAITFAVRAIDAATNGDPTPATRAWALDSTPPAKTFLWIEPRPLRAARKPVSSRAAQGGAPRVRVPTTARFQTTGKLRVRWAKLKSGTTLYDVERRLGTPAAPGTYSAFRTDVTTSSANFDLEPGMTACFRVRTQDSFGNNSEWFERCTTLPYKATSGFVISGGSKQTGPGYYFGQYVRRQGVGVNAPFLRYRLAAPATPQQVPVQSAVTVKRIALVVTKCPDCGKIRVVVGGLPTGGQTVVDKTVDLTASETRKRSIVGIAIFQIAAPNPQRNYIFVLPAGGNSTRRVEGVGASPF